MNNEPVAWITMSGLSYQQTGLNDRPLYTHPAKTLTGAYGSLSDEEIKEVLTEIAMDNENVYSFDSYDVFESMEFSKVGIFAFARAILKKANEK
jgi:hypothetical protein